MRNPRVVDTGGDDLGITANVDEAIEDHLTYSVQVSTDEGRTWQTIGVGLKAPSVALDRRQFRKAQEVQVRVVATNGLTSSVVTTDMFRI